MNNVGNKTLLLISDRSISTLVRELCRHHSAEIEARDHSDASVDFACISEWDLLILYSETQASAIVESCRHIKAKRPLGQIIVVAATDEPAFSARCLHQGADDVIAAPWNDVEFAARINAAIRRSKQLQEFQQQAKTSPPITASQSDEDHSNYQYVGDVRLCPVKREVSVLNTLVHLTRTEYVLLTYLLTRLNRPCSSVELLNNVLGYEDENYLPSLHSHISRLRRKINQSNTTSIETIWCYGYRITIG
jgi:DNA-binding response OmpR family regulator